MPYPLALKKTRIPIALTHPLVGATLQEFDRACAAHAVSAKFCPITPVRGNSDFPPGLSRAFLKSEWLHAEMLAKHFFQRGRFMRQTELAEHSGTGSYPFWSYIQLKHFLDDPSRKKGFTKIPTIMESLCSRSTPQSHVISMLYASMLGGSSALLHSKHSFWESTLGLEIDEKNWDRIHLYIHKGSLNVSVQENGYKLKTCWYKTPDIVHKFSPSVSAQCWRCGKAQSTFFHIWWDCPTRQPF